MGAAPSIPTDSKPRLRVIGTGYIRTGTLSFSKACEELLDGPAWHGGAQLLYREDAYVKLVAQCYRSRNDKPVLLGLLREVTAGFVACADLPLAQFAPELLEIYPDAVVVCTERDPARWWRSCAAVSANAQSWILHLLLWPCPGWRWWKTLVQGLRDTDGEHFGETYGKYDLSPNSNQMEKHHKWLQRVIPKEKLHFVNVEDGWEPLCNILGLPIPKTQFPKMNDAKSADAVFKGVVKTAALTWLGILSAGGLAVRVGLWFWTRF